MNIHPNAFVDLAAEIGEGTRIGCFAVIEAGVRIGQRCVIHSHAQVLEGSVIGDDCEIGHGAVIGAAPQDLTFDRSLASGVRLGSGNVLREHVTIHRGSVEGGATELGRGNYLMVGCHVGHDTVIGDRNILANNCLLGGYVSLGDGAFLGGGSAFHQYVRIGSLCMVKGLAGISQDVPPYVLASDLNRIHGLNIVGLRRAGLSAATRKNLKAAFDLLFLAGLNRQEALDATGSGTWEPEAQALIDFFRVDSKRGICRR